MKQQKLEQISALMDEQLEFDEQEFSLDYLLNNVEIQKVWLEYHLIRDSLQNRQTKLGFEIKHGLTERLKQETILYIPKIQQRGNWRGFAVAASIAAITLVVWQAWSTFSQDQTNIPMAHISAQSQNEIANQTQVNKINKDEIAALAVAVNSNEPLQVNSYLRAHQEAMENGFMSASLQEGIQ